MAALLDAGRVLVALLSDVVRVLRGRREELVLVVRFLAVADGVDRVLGTMELHLDPVMAGLGGPEAPEPEPSDVTRVLADAVLLVYGDSVLCRSTIVHT